MRSTTTGENTHFAGPVKYVQASESIIYLSEQACGPLPFML